MSQREYILLLGSNIGHQKKNIETALEKLEQRGLVLKNTSDYLYSEPIEFVSSNIFCNFAVVASCAFSPSKLLSLIKDIEVEMGRVKDSSFYGGVYSDRIIDIDIVQSGKLVFESNKLTIPHQKNLFEREFARMLIFNLGK